MLLEMEETTSPMAVVTEPSQDSWSHLLPLAAAQSNKLPVAYGEAGTVMVGHQEGYTLGR